jgi:hypothetical protein
MPAGHTKHPGGVPPLDPRILRPLWFEEGTAWPWWREAGCWR